MIHPIDAILREIAVAKAEVEYAVGRINRLTEEDLRWAVWSDVLTMTSERFVRLTWVATAAGVEEHQIRLAEEQGGNMAAAVRGILEELA